MGHGEFTHLGQGGSGLLKIRQSLSWLIPYAGRGAICAGCGPGSGRGHRPELQGRGNERLLRGRGRGDRGTSLPA
jgi:hypothetical protein